MFFGHEGSMKIRVGVCAVFNFMPWRTFRGVAKTKKAFAFAFVFRSSGSGCSLV
jgi:hypothetical protein